MRQSKTTGQIKEDIIASLQQHADEQVAAKNMRAHKNRDFSTFGVYTPDLYNIMRQYKKELLSLSFPERLKFAMELFATSNEELGHIAVFILGNSIKELDISDLENINHYPDYFKTWSMTDDYALRVMQPLLLKYREPVLAMLEEWSNSPNIWKRRLSVVIFVRKIGASGQYTDELLKLSDKLIYDEEDLVRKGIGWALKDSMRGNKQRIIEYVKRLREQGVSSTITLYALRDIKDKAERDAILNLKKKG